MLLLQSEILKEESDAYAQAKSVDFFMMDIYELYTRAIDQNCIGRLGSNQQGFSVYPIALVIHM